MAKKKKRVPVRRMLIYSFKPMPENLSEILSMIYAKIGLLWWQE